MNGIKTLAALAAAAIAFWFGSLYGASRLQPALDKATADLAAEREAWGKERLALAEAVREKTARALELERAASNLAARVHAIESQTARLLRSKENEIRKLAKNRPCLSAGLVRLLNDAPSRPHRPADAPSASVAAGPDTAAATDTDVASWIALAIAEHDNCRARIDALRCWRDQAAGAGQPDCPAE